MGREEHRKQLSDAMIAICREVDPATGRIVVYAIDAEVTDNLIFCLGIRARANPELRYFVALRELWENEVGRMTLTRNLESRVLTKGMIDVLGGITEL